MVQCHAMDCTYCYYYCILRVIRYYLTGGLKMTQKIIIVGGVAGGATVAAQIRRQDKTSKVILFDRGNHISFSNCGMPYYIGEVVENRDDLLVEAEAFAEKYGVTVHPNAEVTAIHRSEKQIQYTNRDGVHAETRSEERRVGKECTTQWR